MDGTRGGTPRPAPVPGTVVLGTFEVGQLLGQGGMGTVYRVRHRAWKLDLAMKCLRPELLARPGSLEDFTREAETWLDLELHPNVVTCHFVRRLEGSLYVFAELMEGGSVEDAVCSGALYAGSREAATARVLQIALECAQALQHAHRAGLVHQDVKPHNLLLGADGTSKLGDFGLARARSRTAAAGDEAGATTRGMTPAYASPEQVGHERLGPPTDLWSWSACLVEFWRGGVTWGSGLALPSVLEGLRADPAEGVDGLLPLPASLAELLARCLERDPRERPTGWDEPVAVLSDLLVRLTGRAPALTPGGLAALADGWNNRAASLLEIERWDKAREALGQALAVDPAHPQARYNLGLLDWRRGEGDDELLARTLGGLTSAKPKDGARRALEAWVCLERGALERFDELAAAGAPAAFEDESGELLRARATIERGTARIWSHPLPPRRDHECLALSADGSRAWLAGDRSIDEIELDGKRVTRALSGPPAAPGAGWRYERVASALGGSHVCALRADYRDQADGPFVRRVTEQVSFELFSLGEGALRWQVPLGPFVPQALAVSPDGRRAVGALFDLEMRAERRGVSPLTTLWLFELESRTASPLPPDTEDPERTLLGAVAWLDDERVVVANHRRLVTVDVRGRRVLDAWADEDLDVGTLSGLPGGRHVASGGRFLFVWDLQERRASMAARGVPGYFGGQAGFAAVLPLGRTRLVSGELDGWVRVWDVASGRCLHTSHTEGGGVLSMGLTEDGRHAAVLGRDSLLLYRLAPPELPRAPWAIVRPLPTSRVREEQARAAARLAAVEEAVERGSFATAREALAAAREDREVARSPRLQSRARTIAAAGDSRRGSLRDAWMTRTLAHGLGAVNALALSADGEMLAVGGQRSGRVEVHWLDGSRATLPLELGRGEVYGLSVDGASRLLAGVTDQGWLCVFTMPDGGEVLRAHLEDEVLSQVCLSADGRYVLASDYSGGGRLWDVSSGLQVAVLRGHERVVNGASLSSDASVAATVGADGRLCVWQAREERLATEVTLASAAQGVALSADGDVVLAAEESGVVSVWDARTGAPRGRLEGGSPYAITLAIPADRRHALVPDRGGVSLWDLSTAVRLHHVPAPERDVYDVSASRDLHVMAARATDSVFTWSLAWDLASAGDAP